MATFGWSYKSNVSGVKRPKEVKRNVEDWQKDREDVKVPLHRQSHSAESVGAGMKRRRYHPRAKIFVGNLNKDTKPVTLAEYFSFFGEIAYMKIVKDRETGVSRGFAFITYVEVQEAEKAVRWCRGNHPRVDGKEIKVGFAERRFGPVPKNSSALSANSSLKERRETHTLYWEYKWTQDSQSEVYGPYETGLMLQWYKMGYFSAGCFVRQVHHASTNQDYTTQGSQNINKSLPTLPSLVDAYSSSSDDEETQNKRPKVETTQHKSEDYLENNKRKVNTKTMELEVEDGTNEQNSEQELQKCGTKNDAKINDEDDNLLKNESEHENVIDKHQKQTSQKDDNLPKNGNEKGLSESECVESSDETIRKYDNLYKTGPESDKSIEETSEQTSKELEHFFPNDNEFINESNGNDEDNLHSWYQKDEEGYKTSDMFGRDSSSEDEDYDFVDQQLSENEFVHINEIDFSMFP